MIAAGATGALGIHANNGIGSDVVPVQPRLDPFW